MIRRWSAIAAAALLLPIAPVSGAASPGSAPAAAATEQNDTTVWLCRPGERPNPCGGSLKTTVFRDGGKRVYTPRTKKRPIDCFYVYPTVSQQPGVLADRSIDPELRSIAGYQAARFSEVCKVYAPVYRQITLAGLGGGATDADRQIAYGDVLQAWRTYLRTYSRGRDFVLIGHSQGAGVLRRLMAEQIDDKPALRKRLVSGLLLGTAVSVRKGKLAGGDFDNIPGCSEIGQRGCVISYATFGQTPPDNSFFGVVRPGRGQPAGSRYEALCTNPAALAGGWARLRTVTRSTPIYGALGAAQVILYGGPPPSAATPWLVPADRYRGRCVTRNGARVMLVQPRADAQVLNPSPTPEWGLHLMDVNLPLGNLVTQVARGAVASAQSQGRG